MGFINYMAADEVVRIIFENMFRDELNPERTEKRNILDPDFSEAGIKFEAGKMSLGDNARNVYVLTCDFALPEITEESISALLADMINEERENRRLPSSEN
ncbi:MAG: hypothetical protein R2941_13220 [Desulfobacterales bacterium]